MNEMIEIKLKKGEVMQLNNLLGMVKVGKASTECAFALLDTKVGLAHNVHEVGETGKMAQEELKSGGESKYIEYMNRYLDEETSVKVRKISRDDLFVLVKENDLNVQQMEMLNLLV